MKDMIIILFKLLLMKALIADISDLDKLRRDQALYRKIDWSPRKKNAFDERLMVSSSSTSEGSSGPYRSEQPQPSYSPGPYRSAQLQSSYSSGPHIYVQPQPSYSSGPCRSEPIECSNCKVKDLTINRLESRNMANEARLMDVVEDWKWKGILRTTHVSRVQYSMSF
ncbi:hypothetical protein Tco_1072770 [Tanacetum coccineum]